MGTMERIPNLDAGQSLLESLNRRRDRAPKVDEKVRQATAKEMARYMPSHAIPVEELVLRNPVAEVHSLPERLVERPSPLDGVRRMASSKEERHKNCRQLLEEKLREEDSLHKKKVQDSLKKFEKKLKANTEHVQALFVNLEEGKILSMEEDMFREISEEIMLQTSVRRGWIDDLGEQLRDLELKRRQTTEAALHRTMGQLVDIAHLSEGALQRFLESKALQTNFNILENSKVYAEFQRRLRNAEVAKEKKCREDLDAGLVRWRQLRTRHAIDCFVERVRSDEVSDPPSRKELFGRIADKQAKIYEALEVKLASVAELMPPKCLHCHEAKVESWVAGALENVSDWQAKTMKIVERLWYEEGKLQERVEAELSSLKEDILGYGALGEQETADAIERDCLPVAREREAYARGLVQRCADQLDSQFANWRGTCEKLGSFLASVLGSQERHVDLLGSMERKVRADLDGCRQDFTEANDTREDDLEAARGEISKSNTDVDLEKHVEVALSRLDGIEEGYRHFHKDMLELVHAYPVDVSGSNSDHWRQVCGLLFVKTGEEEAEEESKQEDAEGGNAGDTEAEAEAEAEAQAEGEGQEAEAEVEEEEPLEPLDIGGSKYELAADIYKKLFQPEPEPEPEPAAEGEEEGEEEGEAGADEGEAGEGEGEEASKEPELVIPDPVEEIPVSERLMREILEHTQVEMLAHIVVYSSDKMAAIRSWATMQEEHLTDELDSRLRSHRPRAGRIEEEDREFRSVELAGQRRRFDRHLRKAVHALKRQRQEYEQECASMDGEIERLVQRIHHAKQHLSTTASVKGLDIRIRETQKLKAKLVANVKALVSQQVETCERRCEGYLALNDKFCEDNFRSEQSAATYGEETIQASTAQLERLDQEARGDLEKQHKELEEREQKCVEEIEQAYAQFESQTEPHREDLALLEQVDSCLNQAKSQLRSEFSCSYTISERISAEIASLDALRPTREAHQSDGEGRGAAFGVLLAGACQGMYALDSLLQFYCSYLQCLRSEVDPSGALSSLNELEKDKGESETAATRREEFFKSETLSAAVEALISDSRQSLIKTAESYYSSKKADEITRKGRIPADAKTMKEQIEETLSGLSGQADEHSSAMLSDVRELIILASRSLERVPGKIMRELVGCVATKAREKLRGVLEEFKVEYGQMRRERTEHEKSLRPSLANPLLKSEFELLCKEEEERTVECKKVLRQFSTRILETAHGELAKCNAELSRTTGILATLLDASVFIEDVEVEGQLDQDGDQDKDAIPAKHLVSLQRYREFASADAQRSEVKGRPFKLRSWEDQEPLSLETIGWEGTLTDLLGSNPEEGEEDPSFEQEPSGDPLKSFETPQAFALVVTRNRAQKNLREELSGAFRTILEEIKASVVEESEWQKKWPKMLQGLSDL